MEDEILKQLAHEKRIEKEMLQVQEDNIRKPKLTIDDEIMDHQKEIRKLELQKFQAGNPEFERQRIARLRREVEAHQREQRLIDDAINRNWAQLTHKDPSGRLIFGS